MSGSSTISNITPAAGNLRVQTSVYGSALPLAYGRPRLSGNLLWYGGFVAVPHTSTQSSGGKGGGGGVKTENTTFTYAAAIMMALCEGPINSVRRVFKGKTSTTGDAATSGLNLATGTPGQAVWGYLTSNYPANALGYSGLAYVYAPAYDLGSDATISNHSFEIGTPWEVVDSGDANPASVAQDLLTNLRYGANFDGTKAGSFGAWATYCLAQNLVMSPVLTEQKAAAEWLKYLLDLSNTDVVWSQNALKYVPLGDVACSANGASYTPNTTPTYDLTDDHFLAEADTDPLRLERKANDDMYNHVRLEYTNRTNQYNTEVAEAKDMADIDRRGLRTKATQEAHAVCDPTVASLLASLLLQRELGVRNVYKFTLPWTFALLEPLDLVTVTDPYLGLLRVPVRINTISETEAGDFEVEAEDCPIGIASAPAYGNQAGAGFAHNYNASPGSVTSPTFFEAPVQLTTTGLEVYTAVAGGTSMWGGCTVWVSLDGISYRKASRMVGASRYGTLTAGTASGASTLAVQLAGLGGQLLGGTLSDAQALNTLVWVDGPNDGGEYLSYQAATLTAVNAYTLGSVLHSAYGTTQQAHANGAKWARVDDAIGKSGPLDLTFIGKTVYFKFTSYNVYGGGEEDLASVTAYSYTITGGMAKLPPSDVGGFASSIDSTGVIKLLWNDIADADRLDFELRTGASWATATLVTRTATLDYRMPAVLASTYTYWIAARDAFLNYSRNPVSLAVVVAGPSAPTLSILIVGPDEVLSWTIPASGSLADRYEVRYGASWAVGTYVDTTKATSYRRKADYVGNRIYWVSAIDAAGNVGTAGSVVLNISSPSVVIGLRTDIIDNDVLLYWSPPATGTLPLDRYEIRKGASWVAGTVIGSNADSTFAMIFEQQSGTYTYWIAAVDSAGNAGVAASVSAFVNQPPDYILRANITSLFTGTKVSALANGTGLLVPVNMVETWSQHFSSNAYATPQAQISAGNPVYISPSTTSATYTEYIDYGSNLPATNVSTTLDSTVLSGAVVANCQISYKLAAGDAWTNGPAGATSVLAVNFRYVQVVYTFTAAAGPNLLRLNGLNIKLSIKNRSDSGSNVASIGGTVVYFGYPFIAADAPIVQAVGLDSYSKPFAIAVIYSGIVNPTNFSVRIFDSKGVEVGGSFSWSVKGY